MSSPLNKLKKTNTPSKGGVTIDGLTQQVIATHVPAQPTENMITSVLQRKNVAADVPRQLRLPVKESDIEALGEGTAQSVSQTTERITSKFTVNNFGGLGDILTEVQYQADSLDMSEFTKNGLFNKIKRGFTDIRKVLHKRMTSANESFTQLEKKIADQITILTEWNKDLSELYKENMNNHARLTKQITDGEKILKEIEQIVARFPTIDPNDPNAFMYSQQLSEAQTLLNMLQIKIDTWTRLKIICESHGPNIQHKQAAGRNAIGTLRRLMTEMIPMVKMEFALHLQNLEIQKTIKLVDATQEMGNQALITNADSSRDAALAAAKAANAPMISTQTLEHIRARMLETATGVAQLRQDAQATREQDKVALAASQQEFFNAINANRNTGA